MPKAELQQEIQFLYNSSEIRESENQAQLKKQKKETQQQLETLERQSEERKSEYKKTKKNIQTLKRQSKERESENKKLKEKITLLQNREKDIFGEDTQYILQAITLLSAVLSTFLIGITVYQLFKRRPREVREEEENRNQRQATVNAIRQQRYNPTAPRIEQGENIELLSTKRRTQHIRVPRTNTQQ